MAYFSRAHEVRTLTGIVSADAPEPVAVIGPEGSGKSRLLKELAATSTMPVVAVRGSETEESWPYAGLSALLAQLDGVLGSSCLTTVSDLLRPALESTPLAISQSLDTCIRAARHEPFLVVIDDTDLLDPISQQILGYVFRRSGTTEMRVALTVSEMSPSSPFHGLRRMRLEPLDVTELLELGRSMRSSGTSTSTLEHVARASGGSPMAFKSILTELPENVLTGEAPFPIAMRTGTRLSELVEEQLRGLSTIARQSLDHLSTAQITPVGLFDRLEGTSREALDELIASGVVIQEYGHLYIVSVPVRSVVYRALTARTRLAIHAELTRAAGEEHPAMRTWHASFTEHDPRHSPDLLLAAQGFAMQGWIRIAVDFAERALALNSDGDLSEHLGQLAKAFMMDANLNLARRYLHRARRRDLDVAILPDLATITVILDYVQRQELGIHGIEHTLETFSETDPVGCTRLLIVAALCHLERWELDEAKELITRAAALDGHDPRMVDALAELATAYEAGLTGTALPGACAMSRISATLRVGLGAEPARIFIARALSLAERYTEARSALQDVTDHGPYVSKLWTLLALQMQFANEVRAGNYHRVRDTFTQIDRLYRSQAHFMANHAYMTSVLNSLEGRRDTATDGVHTGMRIVTRGAGAALEAQIAVRQGRISMSRHRFDLAADHFFRARHLAGPLPNPQLLRFHVDFIATLIRAGRDETAREILSEFRTAAQQTPSAWATRSLEICEALVLTDEQALPALLTILENWADGDHEYLRARTLYLLAFVQDRLGLPLEAAESTQRAREIFREIGVEQGSAPCAPEETSPAGTPLLDLLTEKERAVVEILATGAKNQAIAHELFISVRAVELRLTNIFRKVGVTSRFELMKVLEDELATWRLAR